MDLLNEFLQLIENDKIVLNESSVSGMKQQFPSIPEKAYANLLPVDPEYDGNNKCGIVTRWLCQNLNKYFKNTDDMDLDTARKIMHALAIIEMKLKEIKDVPNAFNNIMSVPLDINAINNHYEHTEFAEFIEKAKELKQAKKRSTRTIQVVKESLKLGGKEIYNDKDFLVYIPFTKESSKAVRGGEGNDTLCVWCTAWDSNNQWYNYMRKGYPLKIVLDKKTYKLYQYCDKNMGQWAGFRDQHNNEVDMDSIVSAPVKEVLINTDSDLYSKLANEVLREIGKSADEDTLKILNRYAKFEFETKENGSITQLCYEIARTKRNPNNLSLEEYMEEYTLITYDDLWELSREYLLKECEKDIFWVMKKYDIAIGEYSTKTEEECEHYLKQAFLTDALIKERHDLDKARELARDMYLDYIEGYDDKDAMHRAYYNKVKVTEQNLRDEFDIDSMIDDIISYNGVSYIIPMEYFIITLDDDNINEDISDRILDFINDEVYIVVENTELSNFCNEYDNNFHSSFPTE